MANGLSPKEILLDTAGVTLGASVSNQVVSKEEGLSAGGALNLRITFKASSVTSSTGITAKLQHKIVDTWTDVNSANASVAITANGVYSIKLNKEVAADIADMPLCKQVRLVCSTGAGDAVTFNNILIQQEL